MQFHRESLQLHPGLESIGRSGTSADDLPNIFFHVDERLLHSGVTVCQRAGQHKPETDAHDSAIRIGRYAQSESVVAYMMSWRGLP